MDCAGEIVGLSMLLVALRDDSWSGSKDEVETLMTFTIAVDCGV